MSDETCTLDGFLGGRLTIAQPKRGFRAGHDTVLLAACVPAQLGDHLLELGAGTGVASLCLAARIPDATVLGVEIDAGLVALANANAERNAMADRVSFATGDVTLLPRTPDAFDHIFFNPPFHPESGDRSPSAARDRAMRDTDNALREWTGIALSLVHDGGTVTAIVRADRADDMLAKCADHAVTVFPLFPRDGEAPKRIIVQIRKGASGSRNTAVGLILHQGDGRNTEAAEAVLRHGAALRLA